MPDILTDLSPAALSVAIKANLYAFFQALSAPPQNTLPDGSLSFRWYTGIPHPWFNGVLCSRSPAGDAARTVRDTLGYFQAQSVSDFSWWLAPELDAAAWSPHLLQHGFQFIDSTPGMAIKLDDLPPPAHGSLSLQRVEDLPALRVWVDTFARGFDLPDSMARAFLAVFENFGFVLPIRHYLGLLDNQPVATSSVFFGAGVAGIYNVATLENVRGQGFGTAMTLTPLYEARQLDYRAGILQSSEMGYPVYQRLGFQKLCQMEHFYWSVQKQ